MDGKKQGRSQAGERGDARPATRCDKKTVGGKGGAKEGKEEGRTGETKRKTGKNKDRVETVTGVRTTHVNGRRKK